MCAFDERDGISTARGRIGGTAGDGEETSGIGGRMGGDVM